jgi:hypothetical protein
MSLEYDNRFESGTIYCDGSSKDGCHGEVTFQGDFASVVEQIKVHDWRTMKDDGEWKHFCPACKEANNEK